MGQFSMEILRCAGSALSGNQHNDFSRSRPFASQLGLEEAEGPKVARAILPNSIGARPGSAGNSPAGRGGHIYRTRRCRRGGPGSGIWLFSTCQQSVTKRLTAPRHLLRSSIMPYSALVPIDLAIEQATPISAYCRAAGQEAKIDLSTPADCHRAGPPGLCA